MAAQARGDQDTPKFRYTAALANEIERRWLERWDDEGTYQVANPAGPLQEGWEQVADRMSVRPARIGLLGDHGQPLAAGAPANLVLVDPAARRVIDPMAMTSRSRNTPYAGRELPGAVVATFLRGQATVLDGKLQ